MKRILLVRHGESTHNAERNCLSGVSDVSLTDLGRRQAAELAGFFEHVPLAAVYVSPLRRAIETAQIALPAFSSAMEVKECLTEFDYGDYEGVSADELGDGDPVVAQWNHAPGSLTFPNGGSISEHAERALEGLLDLVRQAPTGTLACFSHKVTIRLIAAEVLGLPLDYFRRVPCDNVSISEFLFAGNSVTVKRLNLVPDVLNKWRGA